MYLFGCLFLSMLVAGGRRSSKLFLHQIYFYSIIFYLTHCLFKYYLVKVLHLKSLLNKLPRLPKCLSVWVPKCPSSWVPKCPSALSIRVPKCSSSARLPWVTPVPDCPNALSSWVPLDCPLSAQFPFEWSSIKGCLEHYKKWTRS